MLQLLYLSNKLSKWFPCIACAPQCCFIGYVWRLVVPIFNNTFERNVKSWGSEGRRHTVPRGDHLVALKICIFPCLRKTPILQRKASQPRSYCRRNFAIPNHHVVKEPSSSHWSTILHIQSTCVALSWGNRSIPKEWNHHLWQALVNCSLRESEFLLLLPMSKFSHSINKGRNPSRNQVFLHISILYTCKSTLQTLKPFNLCNHYFPEHYYKRAKKHCQMQFAGRYGIESELMSGVLAEEKCVPKGGLCSIKAQIQWNIYTPCIQTSLHQWNLCYILVVCPIRGISLEEFSLNKTFYMLLYTDWRDCESAGKLSSDFRHYAVVIQTFARLHNSDNCRLNQRFPILLSLHKTTHHLASDNEFSFLKPASEFCKLQAKMS